MLTKEMRILQLKNKTKLKLRGSQAETASHRKKVDSQLHHQQNRKELFIERFERSGPHYKAPTMFEQTKENSCLVLSKTQKKKLQTKINNKYLSEDDRTRSQEHNSEFQTDDKRCRFCVFVHHGDC